MLTSILKSSGLNVEFKDVKLIGFNKIQIDDLKVKDMAGEVVAKNMNSGTNTKMIEILSESLKKLSNKRQILVIKNLLANYKVKVGEVEEAKELYEEVIENGNKLYVVEKAKEKLKKLVNNEN